MEIKKRSTSSIFNSGSNHNLIHEDKNESPSHENLKNERKFFNFNNKKLKKYFNKFYLFLL